MSAALVFTEASAQQIVYPAKDQTPEVQTSGETACHTCAVAAAFADYPVPAPARAQ